MAAAIDDCVGRQGKDRPMSTTPMELHRDHAAWRGEIDLWRDDLRAWQSDVRQVRFDLPRIEDALKRHENALQVHGSAVRMTCLDIGGHEHAIAEAEKAGKAPLESCPPHSAIAATVEDHRRRHAELKQLHHEMVAQWKQFLAAMKAFSQPLGN